MDWSVYTTLAFEFAGDLTARIKFNADLLFTILKEDTYKQGPVVIPANQYLSISCFHTKIIKFSNYLVSWRLVTKCVGMDITFFFSFCNWSNHQNQKSGIIFCLHQSFKINYHILLSRPSLDHLWAFKARSNESKRLSMFIFSYLLKCCNGWTSGHFPWYRNS